MAKTLRENGRDLAYAREAIGMSREQVADICDMTAAEVEQCERGDCRDVLLLSRYAEAVGVLWVLPVATAAA